MSRILCLLTCPFLLTICPGTLSAADAATLTSGALLKAKQQVISPDGRFRFVMQDDGNLVLYQGAKALWDSGTCGVADATCHMQQEDGNLVVYGMRNGERMPVWSSGTYGHKGAQLDCQSDGNVVIYDNGSPVWATNTRVGELKAEAEAELCISRDANKKDLSVYVNGERIGKLQDGTDKATLKFVPNRNGRNVIYVEQYFQLSPNDVSKNVPFTLGANGSLECFIDYESQRHNLIEGHVGFGPIVRLKTSANLGQYVDERIRSVVLDPVLKAVEYKREKPFTLLPGITITIERTERCERSVSITESSKRDEYVRSIDAIAGANGHRAYRGMDGTAALRYFESSTRTEYGKRVTSNSKQELECKLSWKGEGREGATQFQVVWYKQIQTGTATVWMDGKDDVKIPFELVVDLVMQVEPVK